MKKKLLSILLVLVLTLSLTAGCSPEEKGMAEQLKEISRIGAHEYSGSIDLDFTNFSLLISPEDKGFRNAFGHHRLEYLGVDDPVQGKGRVDAYIIDKETGKKDSFISLLFFSDRVYIKVDDYVRYMKNAYGDPKSNAEADRIFSGVEYVSVSRLELESMMASGARINREEELSYLAARGGGDISAAAGVLDALVQGFDQYSSGLVKKDGERYSADLQGPEILELYKGLSIYWLNNLTRLGEIHNSYLRSLSDEDLKQLNLTPEKRYEMIRNFNDIISFQQEKRERDLKSLQEMSLDKTDLRMNDTSIGFWLEKTGPDSFQQGLKVHLNVTSGISREFSAKLDIDQRHAIRPTSQVRVDEPTGAVFSFTELQDRAPRSFRLLSGSKEREDFSCMMSNGYVSRGGRITLKNVDGSFYFPLDQAGAFLEKAVWDAEKGQPYFERKGERVYVPGLIIDGRQYIKVRGLESLGYKIRWYDTHVLGYELVIEE